MFNQAMIAPYIEAGAALVDYLEQPLAGTLNRDAGDYYGKAGVRVTFAPARRADIGGRWNDRVLDDLLYPEFNSNYFDASATWSPSSYFSITAAIDRTIAEPLGAFGRFADVKSYRAGLTYLPFDRVTLSVAGKRETLEDYGSSTLYRVHEVEAEAAYRAASWVQFYAGLYYEHVDEDRGDVDYEEVKVGAGMRIKLGEGAGGASDPFVLPFSEAATWHGPTGATLSVSSGPSRLYLPDQAFVTVVGGTFFDEALYQRLTHDGDLSGALTTVRLDDAARHTFASGETLKIGFSGFYGYYEDRDHRSCHFTATTDCAFVNIDDFDLDDENNTGPFGQFEIFTDREVYYWGVASTAKLDWMKVGEDGAATVLTTAPFKLGLDVRGLHERTHLLAIDTSVPDPVDYREDLDTYYYGGFVGFENAIKLGNGFSLSLDGKAGIYYAYTTYEGRYLAFIPVGGGVFVLERGAVDRGEEETAFIADATVTLTKDFAWGILGVFAQGEYLSYVPRVGYNNDDQAGGSPFGIVGTQVGTEIVASHAWNYTLGMTVKLPF
jgi:hypothetical protein